MNISSIERKLFQLMVMFSFLKNIDIIDKTQNTIKAKLIISHVCFVQVYYNIKKDLTSFALVFNNERIYGRNSSGGNWHLHPIENPNVHDFSGDYGKPVEIEEFLLEICDIMQEKKYLF